MQTAIIFLMTQFTFMMSIMTTIGGCIIMNTMTKPRVNGDNYFTMSMATMANMGGSMKNMKDTIWMKTTSLIGRQTIPNGRM